MMTEAFGGIEAGGTKFVCAVGSGPESMRDIVRIDTTTPSETFEQVLTYFQKQKARYALKAIGIGSFGPIDLEPGSPSYGYITSTPKPHWADTEFATTMERNLKELPMIKKIRLVDVAGLMAIGLALTLWVKPAAGNELKRNQEESGWHYELKAGLLAHDVDNLWSRSRKEDGVDINAEIIFGRPHFSLLSGTIRPNLGLSINNQGDTSKLYAGILWMYETKASVFLNLGIGAAIHNGELETGDDDEKELGARLLFRIPIELGICLTKHHRISILFDHISNAYLASPNEGLDTLGVRYGYRF